MKLKITKFEGTIEAEIEEGSLTIDDVRRLLIRDAGKEKKTPLDPETLTRYTEKVPI